MPAIRSFSDQWPTEVSLHRQSSARINSTTVPIVARERETDAILLQHFENVHVSSSIDCDDGDVHTNSMGLYEAGPIIPSIKVPEFLRLELSSDADLHSSRICP